MPVSTTAHIRLDDRGVAWIGDTNTKAIEVALDMIAHGWSLEEIHFQHSHLRPQGGDGRADSTRRAGGGAIARRGRGITNAEAVA